MLISNRLNTKTEKISTMGMLRNSIFQCEWSIRTKSSTGGFKLYSFLFSATYDVDRPFYFRPVSKIFTTTFQFLNGATMCLQWKRTVLPLLRLDNLSTSGQPDLASGVARVRGIEKAVINQIFRIKKSLHILTQPGAMNFLQVHHRSNIFSSPLSIHHYVN